MPRFCLEKPDAVFYRVPQIQDICIEFGVDPTDAKTITCMYELFRRITEKDQVDWDSEVYNEGYREGYNDAIDDAESKLDGITWEIGKLKKD
jgi:hypothetical protein